MSIPFLPSNASLHGSAVDSQLLLNLWVALAILALSHLLLLLALLLRRGSPLRSSLAWEHLPVAVFAVILVLLTIRSERLWAASRYTGADLSALQVEAVGMQFAWYFRYPGADAAFGETRPELIAPGEGNPLGLDPKDPRAADDVVTSELVLPAHREIDLRLHAQDVIHGFSVPALRLKQNAIPGASIHIHFMPAETGTYAILCTQLCGSGHYRMTANLRIVTPEDYSHWLTTKASR